MLLALAVLIGAVATVRSAQSGRTPTVLVSAAGFRVEVPLGWSSRVLGSDLQVANFELLPATPVDPDLLARLHHLLATIDVRPPFVTLWPAAATTRQDDDERGRAPL
jgi:hypothetical protein